MPEIIIGFEFPVLSAFPARSLRVWKCRRRGVRPCGRTGGHQSMDVGQFPGGLTLTAIDRLVGWRRKASRCGLTPTPIDLPCLSPDLSAAREHLAVRFCLAD